jgi:hypothetical protein
MLITYALQKPKVEISIVAETIPHLRRGALRDFLKIMDMVGHTLLITAHSLSFSVRTIAAS